MEPRLYDTTIQTGTEPLAELSVVRLRTGVTIAPDRYLPAGAVGAIVSVYDGGKAYHVEFASPFHALEILTPDKISPVREATRERFIEASENVSDRRG